MIYAYTLFGIVFEKVIKMIGLSKTPDTN